MSSPPRPPVDISTWRKTARWLMILPLRVYKHVVSPWLPAACIYHPSCSRYTMEAVAKHGVIGGLILGAARLGRCIGVFFTGGYDPVPDRCGWGEITGGYRRFRRGRKSPPP